LSPFAYKILFPFAFAGAKEQGTDLQTSPGAEQKFKGFGFVYDPQVHNNTRSQTKSMEITG
jgi:hypothetical protein